MPDRFNVLPQVGENESPNARMAPVPQGQFDTRLAQQNLQAAQEAHQQIGFYDAMDRMTKLKTWENESGYQSVLGENARELPKRMRDEYQKRAGELADTISDPRARMVFQRKADENSVSFLGAVEHHALRQKTVAEAQKTDAFVEQWQDAGVRAGSSGNHAEMERAANEIDGVRRLWGQQNGIPQPALERVIRQDNSKVYGGAINSMLDGGRDLDAQAAFDKYKDALTERDRGHLERALEQGSRLGSATREHDRIMAPSFKGVPTGGNNWTQKEVPGAQTMDEVRAESAKITDPKTRHMVEEMARQTFADRHLADKQRNEQTFTAIAKRIEQHPGVDPQGLATPDEWENKLTDPDMKTALKKLAYPREQTDPAVFTSMMSVPLQDLAKYNDAQMLSQFGSHMTIADYEKALNRRDTARKGGPAYDAIAQHDATLMSVFLKSGLGGVKPSDTVTEIAKDDKKQAALMQFWEAVDRGRLSDQHATGKKVDDETTRKVAEKTALFLQKKVNLIRREPLFGAEYLADRALGRKEATVSDFLSNPDMADQEVEMPREFAQELFDYASARPGTIAKGTTFQQWAEKDRKAINRAYFAFLAGASNPDVKAAYVRGK